MNIIELNPLNDSVKISSFLADNYVENKKFRYNYKSSFFLMYNYEKMLK